MAAVSSAAAVGWFVSPIIRSMVSVVQSYMSSQYSWKSEMVSDLKNLEATLTEVLLVVGAAERRHVVDRNQIMLLRKLKVAVCDAEDVLDKFNYVLIRETIEQQRGMVRRIGSASVSVAKRLVGLDKLRSELQKVIKSMTGVRNCADMFVRVMEAESTDSIPRLECVSTRATGSLLHEDSIFGRKEEVEELVSVLLKQNGVSLPDYKGSLAPEVHAVIGIGGIGKTTLAQLIYNDKRIVDSFDLRMWVCVSRNFDKVILSKEIIAHTSDEKNIKLDGFSFSMLQSELFWKVRNKKFFLVLDDVWYDENFGEHINKERWRELLAPMKNALAGSKVLVTTRMELVAKMLNSQSSFFLQGLAEDASWSLFRSCFYSPYCNNLYPDLKGIGKEIVQRLNGLPLALKVIGGHLNGKYMAAEWNEVLRGNTLNPNDILTTLRLSYDGLPYHLQHSFAYCSLFPKGFHIDPKKLIHMWIAHGFVEIEGSTNKTLEDVGRSYFNELLTRSFFQMIRCGNQTFYVMHDIMNDLALHVSEGECVRVEHESMEEIPIYTRHLSVSSDNMGNLMNYDLTALRSLIILSKSWFCPKVCLNHDILERLKSVRVLDISGCCLETLPNAVNKLIHLRYLGIQRTYYPLPKKILMYNLQALFVQYHSCYSSKAYGSSWGQPQKTVSKHFHLPESINKLPNLLHVDVEKAYVLMLSCTHKIPYVECAGEFHIGNEGSLLGLKDLNNLQGQLTIMSLDKAKGREEASKAHLHLKGHITKLELQWGSDDVASVTNNGFEVLDVLKPHPGLEELTISGYPGALSPSWLEFGWLSRVQFICLRDCKIWEVLPPLGNLLLLKTLEIRRMEELKTLGQEFFGCAGFPSLERLLLERLPNLELFLPDNNQVFHNLRHLSVAGCPKLRSYPTHPRTLGHIAILDQEHIQVKTYIDSVEISRSFCCLVSSFFHVLRAHHLEFVENMEIYVNYVGGVSRTVFENLKSLKKLKIYGIYPENTCSVITTLWDENGFTVLPSSLWCLELERCYLQPSSLSKLLNNLSSLNALRLSKCYTVEIPCPPLSLSHLRMLKTLHICRCDWITSFEGSDALVSLEEMELDECYDLEYVPDLDGMPSLQKLQLQRCPQVMRLSNAGHHTALKELDIYYCVGLSSLGELRGLVSLTKLKVARCSDLVLLPDMSSFHSLEILIIADCPRLRSLPRRGHLRMLKKLNIYQCDLITSFEGSEPLVSLEELTINHCYGLEHVPVINEMASLQKLHLNRCPQVICLSNVGHQTALKELVIKSCDALSSLGELHGLVSLAEMRITRCPSLISLPAMDSFHSLRLVVIDNCPRLRSLPRSGLPVLLEALHLHGCHPALELQFQQKVGPDWNTVAVLPGCMCCTDSSEQQCKERDDEAKYKETRKGQKK
ncbi:hypothetical protein BS78_02G046700 [Paspalum vaginatum]|nr:hypothetical protein BS78_02G046700 [Paspalum vaginatum]